MGITLKNQFSSGVMVALTTIVTATVANIDLGLALC